MKLVLVIYALSDFFIMIFLMVSEALRAFFIKEVANMRNNKIAPLYERLSRDDVLQAKRNSISNQKQMLEDYAQRNNFPNPSHFIDNGISGIRFDRLGFTTKMEEVEAGTYSPNRHQ